MCINDNVTGILSASPFSGQVLYRASLVIECEFFLEPVVCYIRSRLDKDISSE